MIKKYIKIIIPIFILFIFLIFFIIFIIIDNKNNEKGVLKSVAPISGINDNTNQENKESSNILNYTINNKNAEYALSFKLENINGKDPFAEKITYIGEKLSCALSLKYDCNLDTLMGLMIFADGIPCTFNIDGIQQEDTYFEFLINSEEEKKLIIEIDPVISLNDDNVNLQFILLTEQDKLPYDMYEPFFAYTTVVECNIDILNKVENNKDEEKYINDKANICNVSDIYKAATKEDLDQIKKLSLGNSLNVVIAREDKSLGFFQSPFLYQHTTIDKIKNYYLQITGNPGEYITTVFVDNKPYPVFDGKTQLQWKIDKGKMLYQKINLPIDSEATTHLIYTLTVPSDKKDDTYQKIYDSRKIVYTVSEQTTRSEIESVRKYSTEITDENDQHLDKQNYIYKGGEIKNICSYELLEYDVEENIKFMVLVNGIPQEFKIDGKNDSMLFYDFIVKPEEEKKFKIALTPIFDTSQKIFNIDFIFLTNINKLYYNDGDIYANSICAGNSLAYKIMSFDDINNYEKQKTDIFKYSETTETDKGITNPAFLYNQKEEHLKNNSLFYTETKQNEDFKLIYQTNNVKKGNYITILYLNGELLNVFDNKPYMAWVTDENKDSIKYTMNIPAEKLKEKNAFVILTFMNDPIEITNEKIRDVYNIYNKRLTVCIDKTLKNEENIKNNISIDTDNGNNSEIIKYTLTSDENVYFTGGTFKYVGSDSFSKLNKTIRLFSTYSFNEKSNEKIVKEENINALSFYMNVCMISEYVNGCEVKSIKYITRKNNMILYE